MALGAQHGARYEEVLSKHLLIGLLTAQQPPYTPQPLPHSNLSGHRAALSFPSWQTALQMDELIQANGFQYSLSQAACVFSHFGLIYERSGGVSWGEMGPWKGKHPDAGWEVGWMAWDGGGG